MDNNYTTSFIAAMDQVNSQAAKWKAEKKCQRCGGTDWRCKDPGYVGVHCEACFKVFCAEVKASGAFDFLDKEKD